MAPRVDSLRSIAAILDDAKEAAEEQLSEIKRKDQEIEHLKELVTTAENTASEIERAATRVCAAGRDLEGLNPGTCWHDIAERELFAAIDALKGWC